MNRAALFLILLVIQAICAFVFVADIILSVVGFFPVPLAWTTRELMEIGALTGLLLGLVSGGVLVWKSFGELHRAEARIERASATFTDVLNARFREWGLTSAERDVALFAIKGLSMQQIAELRDTSEGTVKSQTAAIYRKAGVTGRPQLLSLFIEDLMGADVPIKVVAAPDEAA
jgi:DNA-binding CsgD family transcriptional regulator